MHLLKSARQFGRLDDAEVSNEKHGNHMGNLEELLHDMAQPDIWQEFLGLGLALALAYALAWLLRARLLNGSRHVPGESVWFGNRLIDGLLFPLIALVLTYAANRLVLQWQHLSVLKVAVPILMALVAIRFLARTMTLSFPLLGFTSSIVPLKLTNGPSFTRTFSPFSKTTLGVGFSFFSSACLNWVSDWLISVTQLHSC